MIALSDIDKEYISVSEAARRLGVTAPYLYKLMAQGKLPYYKRGVTELRKLEWHEIRQMFELKRIDGESDPGEDE